MLKHPSGIFSYMKADKCENGQLPFLLQISMHSLTDEVLSMSKGPADIARNNESSQQPGRNTADEIKKKTIC